MFGRSNSLSVNTGLANTTQQNNNAAPSQAGSLFGGAAAQASQPQQSTSLFGNTQTSQPAQSGGLFGNTQPSQGGGLFGNTQTAQPAQSGGLFGNSQTAQPAQSGGLFGNTQNNNQQTGGGTSLFGNTTQNNTTGGGLFGGNTQNQQTTGGGLFGNMNQQQTGGGLFGNTNNNQQTTGGGLFGNTQNNTQGGGLFGNTNNTQQTQQGGGLFGASANTGGSLFAPKPNPFGATQNNNAATTSNQNENAGSSIFGLNAVPREHLSQSLLGYSQHRQASQAQFPGSLSMGQGSAAPDTNTAVGAVKVDLGDLRSTTRFQDLIDPLKEQFERADKMIAQQEEFCKKIESFKLVHEQNVKSVAPDVQLIQEKVDAVEHVLASDAQSVVNNKKTIDKDRKDFDRCQRIVENLGLPSSYHLSNLTYGQSLNGQRISNAAAAEGDDSYDINVIGNYFNPMVADLQRTIAAYTSNLTEIEEHMKVIEGSAVTQAQLLAATRAGVQGQNGSDNTVRTLADALRGFENSILTVAGEVGECREGITELSMGRFENGRPGSAKERRGW